MARYEVNNVGGEKTVAFLYPDALLDPDRAGEVTEQRSLSAISTAAPGSAGKMLYYSGYDRSCVTNALDQAGFQRTETKELPKKKTKSKKRWTVYWGFPPTSEQYGVLDGRWQRVNHFPGCWSLGRKDNLGTRLMAMKKLHGKAMAIFPDTYTLPRDLLHFRSVFAKAKRGTLWIRKPVACARGSGIRVLRAKDVRKVLSKHSEQKPRKVTEKAVRKDLLQRYIDDPLLIDGRKFDIRLYVLVTSFDPLLVYVFNDGLVRLCTEPYKTRKTGPLSLTAHITNYSVNKESEAFLQSEDREREMEGAHEGAQTSYVNMASKWSFRAFRRYLRNVMGNDDVSVVNRINEAILKVLVCVENEIVAETTRVRCDPRCCFELFGFDVMLDAALKPYILEVNICPSLKAESPLDTRIKGVLLCDLFHLIGVPSPSKRHKKDKSNKGTRRHKSRRVNGSGGATAAAATQVPAAAKDTAGGSSIAETAPTARAACSSSGGGSSRNDNENNNKEDKAARLRVSILLKHCLKRDIRPSWSKHTSASQSHSPGSRSNRHRRTRSPVRRFETLRRLDERVQHSKQAARAHSAAVARLSEYFDDEELEHGFVSDADFIARLKVMEAEVEPSVAAMSYDDFLNELTEEDIRVILSAEAEQQRARTGGFLRIFPSSIHTEPLQPFFKHERHTNEILRRWYANDSNATEGHRAQNQAFATARASARDDGNRNSLGGFVAAAATATSPDVTRDDKMNTAVAAHEMSRPLRRIPHRPLTCRSRDTRPMFYAGLLSYQKGIYRDVDGLPNCGEQGDVSSVLSCSSPNECIRPAHNALTAFRSLQHVSPPLSRRGSAAGSTRSPPPMPLSTSSLSSSSEAAVSGAGPGTRCCALQLQPRRINSTAMPLPPSPAQTQQQQHFAGSGARAAMQKRHQYQDSEMVRRESLEFPRGRDANTVRATPHSRRSRDLVPRLGDVGHPFTAAEAMLQEGISDVPVQDLTRNQVEALIERYCEHNGGSCLRKDDRETQQRHEPPSPKPIHRRQQKNNGTCVKPSCQKRDGGAERRGRVLRGGQWHNHAHEGSRLGRSRPVLLRLASHARKVEDKDDDDNDGGDFDSRRVLRWTKRTCSEQESTSSVHVPHVRAVRYR